MLTSGPLVAVKTFGDRLFPFRKCNQKAAQPGRFLVTPEGELSQGDAAERLLPQDPLERLAVARRIVRSSLIALVIGA